MKKPSILIKDVDTYLSFQPEAQRTALEKLRKIIKATVPKAEECIGYGMPMYKLNGMLVGFAGAKKHLGFYPCDGSTVKIFKDELEGYSTDKGTIRFEIDQPLPEKLIKKIIKYRVEENLNKEKKYSVKKR